MVMPCSRSDRSPSTSSERSGVDSPLSTLARCTASSWSASTDLVSYSSRPTSVDLPSSTLPAVASLRRSLMTLPRPARPTIFPWQRTNRLSCSLGLARKSRSCGKFRKLRSSEVALPLAILHGRLGEAVVGAGRAALGEPARGHLGDHLVEGRRGRLDGAGARAVADGPVADRPAGQRLPVTRAAPRTLGEPHAVAQVDLPLVRVVDRRQLDALAADVAPHVQLGPVGQREHPHVLARPVSPVVQVPQLRPLPAGLPLAERVAQAEDPLLGAGPLLVPAPTAEHRVEPVLRDGVQKRHGLQRVAGAVRTLGQPAVQSCTFATTSRRPWRSTTRSRNSMTSSKLCPVSTCSNGNGTGAGQNALTARCSSRVESLPPENRITGRSNSPATSRMMWTASDSRRPRESSASTAAVIRAARTRSWPSRPSGRCGRPGPATASRCTARSRSTGNPRRRAGSRGCRPRRCTRGTPRPSTARSG